MRTDPRPELPPSELTPDQRRNAREQYRKIDTLSPGKRDTVKQQWTEYQQLPAHVKKTLATEAKKKPEKIEPRTRTKTAENKKPPGVPVAPPKLPVFIVPASAY